MELRLVHRALRANDNNLTKALRAVLQEAIERQRPPGDRKNTAPEWLVYNILDFRLSRVSVCSISPGASR